MSFATLRTILRNPCIRRYTFFQHGSTFRHSRTLSDVNNSFLMKLIHSDEPSNTDHPQKPTTFENLVSGLNSQLKVKDALEILHKLRIHSLRGEIDPKSFIKDEKFLNICETFRKGCEGVRLDYLVNGLRCILEFGLPPDMELVKVIENEVLWKSRKMTLRTLCVCLDFHTRFQETSQQVQVVKALVYHIRNRWFEIEHASEVTTVLNNRSLFNDDFVTKVEDKIMEFADKIPINELVILLTTFSKQKRRPATVLRSLSYFLVQKQEVLTLRQCCDLCFALYTLHFVDGNILNKITVDALSELQETKAATLVSSLITSCSLLRWDHSVLLECCCEWVEKNVDKWRLRDWASLVISLAHLNYQPANDQVLFSLAFQYLKAPVNGEHDLPANVWLDVVWALGVLGKATHHHLASVLEPSFYEPLINDEVPNSVINKLKLQNIDAVAKVEFPLARMPVLNLSQEFQVPVSAVDQKLRQSVTEALKNILPPPKYLAFNLNTNLGFVITGEFVVDENANPVPLVDYGVKAGNQDEQKFLPAGCKRIALLVWGFKDMTTKTSSLTGQNALSVRLLRKLRYTVVEIPYQEYQNLKTTLQQVMYIQQKIKDQVCKK